VIASLYFCDFVTLRRRVLGAFATLYSCVFVVWASRQRHATMKNGLRPSAFVSV